MAPTTTARTSTTKPYARPSASAKAKGKGKASASASASSSSLPNLGTPSTTGQSSRKGKKAWRKNVDIRNEEEALERAREEERVTGGPVAKKSDGELFTVDTVGDVEVAKRARRAHKPLRSLAVLNERSAVPSLMSRTTSSSSSKSGNGKSKSHISPAEKERLRRIARKTIAHSDGTGLTSADVRATDLGTVSDVWTQEQVQVVVKGGFGEETMIKKSVNVPETLRRQRELHLASQVLEGSAVETPEGGVSYNPSAEAHARLIEQALKEEMELLAREAEVEKLVQERGGVIEGRRNAGPSEFAAGMIVGPGEIEGEDGSEYNTDDEDGRPVRKQSKRKTTAQKNKALRAKMAAQALQAEKEKRKLHNSISSVAAFKKEVEKRNREQREKDLAAKLAKIEKERKGLQGGEKIGRHRLSKKRVQVQLGEDLAESLRQVKPEGNLFKDRFLALQKRSLIEPRLPVMPTRRNKTKEYEKFAYKRFE